MAAEEIVLRDDGWGDKDYLEWAWGRWLHRYTTTLASPHRIQETSNEDRRRILKEFGINKWTKPIEEVDTCSPDELKKIAQEENSPQPKKD